MGMEQQQATDKRRRAERGVQSAPCPVKDQGRLQGAEGGRGLLAEDQEALPLVGLEALPLVGLNAPPALRRVISLEGEGLVQREAVQEQQWES